MTEEFSHASNTYHERIARDRSLVLRIKTGELEAFRVLVDTYLEPLTRFASVLVGALDVAEDITQRVMIRVWEHREMLDAERSIRAYLYQAIRNEGLKEHRSLEVRLRYQASSMAEADAGEEMAVPSPETATIAKVAVEAAIERLPPRRQLAIRLRFEEDLSYQEMGEVMGISAAAAMQVTLRAIDDMRKIFRV